MIATHTKKRMIRIFFVAEVIAFFYIVSIGRQGIVAIGQLRAESRALEQEILLLKNQITQLKTEQEDFLSDPFYAESIAREQLGYAHPHETIFFIA